MKTAVITGASSGLGVDFLRAVVHNYPEIEEIWLIARRKERLEKLAERYQSECHMPYNQCRNLEKLHMDKT